MDLGEGSTSYQEMMVDIIVFREAESQMSTRVLEGETKSQTNSSMVAYNSVGISLPIRHSW